MYMFIYMENPFQFPELCTKIQPEFHDSNKLQNVAVWQLPKFLYCISGIVVVIVTVVVAVIHIL